MIASIELFEALKTRFGEQEAKIIVKEIEKIETGIETKVEKAFDRKKDVLATKEDISLLKEDLAKLEGKLETKIAETKADIIKWMFIFWIGQLASFIAIAKFIFHQ